MPTVADILGADASTLLTHQCKIPKETLHLPGPDFVERIHLSSNRPVSVLGRLQSLFDHGRLGGTGYVSILPVDQGIEHSAGASFAPNPQYFDPEPPSVFLASLDGPADGCEFDERRLFSGAVGGTPSAARLAAVSATAGVKEIDEERLCLLLRRDLALAPGSRKTLRFAYGYAKGKRPEDVLARIGTGEELLRRTLAACAALASRARCELALRKRRARRPDPRALRAASPSGNLPECFLPDVIAGSPLLSLTRAPSATSPKPVVPIRSTTATVQDPA